MVHKCANKIIIKNYNIIKNNIPQTPSKVCVLQSIIFSHTPDEARSVALAKACIPEKNYSVTEKLSFNITKLTMYFTFNKAFINYLDKFPNLVESLEFLIIKNKTTFEQALPISLNISKFDSTLLTTSSNIKEFINSYTKHKEILICKKKYDNTELNTNKNFFSENYIMDIFMFISMIIYPLATTLMVYLLCKHKKL